MKDIILYDLGVTEESGKPIDIFLYDELIKSADPKKIPIEMYSTQTKDCIMATFNYDSTDVNSLAAINECENYLKRVRTVFSWKETENNCKPDILIINDNHELALEVCVLLAR